LIGRKWKAAFHAVGLLGKDTAIRMGLLFLGFPWSVLSVIGLPGTAFPEKWLQRVFKEKYLSSNCFGGNSSEMFQDGTPLLGVSSTSGHLDAPHRVSSGVRVPCVQQCGKKRLQSKRWSKFSEQRCFCRSRKKYVGQFYECFWFWVLNTLNLTHLSLCDSFIF
jgi:hypothetical protein